jgi:hypothetical protein
MGGAYGAALIPAAMRGTCADAGNAAPSATRVSARAKMEFGMGLRFMTGKISMVSVVDMKFI